MFYFKFKVIVLSHNPDTFINSLEFPCYQNTNYIILIIILIKNINLFYKANTLGLNNALIRIKFIFCVRVYTVSFSAFVVPFYIEVWDTKRYSEC